MPGLVFFVRPGALLQCFRARSIVVLLYVLCSDDGFAEGAEGEAGEDADDGADDDVAEVVAGYEDAAYCYQGGPDEHPDDVGSAPRVRFLAGREEAGVEFQAYDCADCHSEGIGCVGREETEAASAVLEDVDSVGQHEFIEGWPHSADEVFDDV